MKNPPLIAQPFDERSEYARDVLHRLSIYHAAHLAMRVLERARRVVFDVELKAT